MLQRKTGEKTGFNCVYEMQVSPKVWHTPLKPQRGFRQRIR